jgi:Effector Associated Constant Component 1
VTTMVEIDVSGQQGEQQLRSLHDWLRNDPQLRFSRVTKPPPRIEPGHMGGVSDVLMIALGSGGAGVALVASLTAWLQTRVTNLTVRISTAAGKVEVKATTSQDPAKLLKQISTVLPVVGDDSS